MTTGLKSLMTSHSWTQAIQRSQCLPNRILIGHSLAHGGSSYGMSAALGSMSELRHRRLARPSDKGYQVGGTAMLVKGRWTGRVSDIGQDRFGRWTWATVEGQGTRTTFIAAYAPCNGGTTSGLNTFHLSDVVISSSPSPTIMSCSILYVPKMAEVLQTSLAELKRKGKDAKKNGARRHASSTAFARRANAPLFSL